MPRAQHSHLTRATRHNVLMTLATALCVVGGAETILDHFDFVKGPAIRVEGVLRLEPVRLVVEAPERLSGRGRLL